MITFLIKFKRIDLSQLILFMVFLHLSIAAMRNIILFSLISYPIVIDNTKDILPRIRPLSRLIPFKNFGMVLLKTATAGYIFCTVFFVTRDTLLLSYYQEGRIEKRFGLGVASSYPKNAIDFILRNDIKGNVFNSFGFGAYYVYRTYPRRKVFMDGRTSVYGDDFLRYYADVNMYPSLFEQMVKKYSIDYFLLDINKDDIFRRLYLDRGNWRLVFFDLNGAVFVRNILKNKKLIEKYEVDLGKLPLDPEQDYSHLRRRPFPTSCFIKGEFFQKLGLNRRAEEEYRLGLRVNPRAAGLYNNIGAIYQNEGKLEEALSLYKKALEIDHRLINASINLGSIYQERGDLDTALKIYQRVLPPTNVPNAMVYNHIGDIFRQKGLLRKALANYEKAIALDPLRFEFYYNKGLVFADMSNIPQALDCFIKARDLHPEVAVVYNNIGSCYMVMKKYDRAEEEFKRALAIEPNLAEAKGNLEKLGKLIEAEQKSKQ